MELAEARSRSTSLLNGVVDSTPASISVLDAAAAAAAATAAAEAAASLPMPYEAALSLWRNSAIFVFFVFDDAEDGAPSSSLLASASASSAAAAATPSLRTRLTPEVDALDAASNCEALRRLELPPTPPF